MQDGATEHGTSQKIYKSKLAMLERQLKSKDERIQGLEIINENLSEKNKEFIQTNSHLLESNQVLNTNYRELEINFKDLNYVY